MRDGAEKDADVIVKHLLIEVLKGIELHRRDRRCELLEMCDDGRCWIESVDQL